MCLNFNLSAVIKLQAHVVVHNKKAEIKLC